MWELRRAQERARRDSSSSGSKGVSDGQAFESFVNHFGSVKVEAEDVISSAIT
jgi:hypothetical protein